MKERERFFEAALTRARRLHQVLPLPLETAFTEYVIFGGDCDLTPARCLMETVGDRVVIRLDADKIRERVPGVDYETLRP